MQIRRDDQKREERPRQAARLNLQTNRAQHTTRDQRRAALLSAMTGANVLSFADGLSRLRARLDALLMERTQDGVWLQQAESDDEIALWLAEEKGNA